MSTSTDRESCKRCGRPMATRDDVGTMEPGEDGGLCWSSTGTICEPRDWPTELAAATAEIERLRAENKRMRERCSALRDWEMDL